MRTFRSVGTLTNNTKWESHPCEATVVAGAAQVKRRASVLVKPEKLAGYELGLYGEYDPIAPGETVAYSVVLGNHVEYGLAQTPERLAVTLPPGTTLAKGPSGSTLDGGLLSWPVGTLAKGGNAVYSFSVTADATLPAGTVLRPIAEVWAFGSVQASAAVTTEVRPPSPLRLVLSLDRDPVENASTNPNLWVAFEYKLANVGPAPVTDIVLSDVNLAAVRTALILSDPVTCTDQSANFCVLDGAAVTPPFELKPGEVRVVSLYKDTRTAKKLAGGLARTFAHVSSSVGSLSRAMSLPVVSPGSGLQLAIASDHDPVAPGEAVTYTVLIGNNDQTSGSLPGGSAGRVSVPLAPGVTFVASPEGTFADGVVTWAFGSVPAKESGRFSFTVTVDPALPDGTVLFFDATASDGLHSLVRARAATDVQAHAPLRLTVTEPQAPLNVGDVGVFSATLVNAGTGTLDGSQLSAVVLEGAHLLASTPTALCESCVDGDNPWRFSWSLGSLTAGQPQAVNWTSSVKTKDYGTIVRTRLRATSGGHTALHTSNFPAAVK